MFEFFKISWTVFMLIFINGLIIWFSKASGTNSEKNFNPEVQVLREIVSD